MAHESGPHGFLAVDQLLLDLEFRRCAERYHGDLRLRDFTRWNQYLAMAFARLDNRRSSERVC